MTGDILVDIAFWNMDEIELEPGVRSMTRASDRDYAWGESTLRFRVQASATELLSDDRRSALHQRIMNRFGQCFGFWDLADRYDRLQGRS